MASLPNHRLSTAAGRGDEGGAGATRLTPLEGQPHAGAWFVAPAWQPAPAGYDWFGPTDPEGLLDGPDALSLAPTHRKPPAAAP